MLIHKLDTFPYFHNRKKNKKTKQKQKKQKQKNANVDEILFFKNFVNVSNFSGHFISLKSNFLAKYLSAFVILVG